MDSHSLLTISPIDGRYASQTKSLSPFFSEYGLIRYRVQVEVEYFISLCSIPLGGLETFDRAKFGSLRAIYQNFSISDAQAIKEIEKTTQGKRKDNIRKNTI